MEFGSASSKSSVLSEDLPGQVSVYSCLAPAGHLPVLLRGMFGERPEGIVWKFGKCQQFSSLRFVTSQSFELWGGLKRRSFVLGIVLVCPLFCQNSKVW